MLKRIEWLDFIKGFMIILVILAHSLNQIQTENISMGVYSLLMTILFTAVMPCFFAVSGYLCKQIDSLNSYWHFLYKKLISLGIPYIVFSVIYVVLQQLSGKNNVHTFFTFSDLLIIYKTPITYLWFLYTLFLMLAIKGLLDLFKLNNITQFIISLIFFVVSILFSNYLSLGIFVSFSNFPYFFVGNVLRDKMRDVNNKNILLLLFFLIVSFIVQSMYIYGSATDFSNQYDIITKILSIVLVFIICPKIKHNAVFNYFDRYGMYTMIIYLVHVPILACVRVFLFHLMKVNNVDAPFIVIILVLFTWMLSILICRLVDKLKLFQIVFYPYKFIQNLFSNNH